MARLSAPKLDIMAVVETAAQLEPAEASNLTERFLQVEDKLLHNFVTEPSMGFRCTCGKLPKLLILLPSLSVVLLCEACGKETSPEPSLRQAHKVWMENKYVGEPAYHVAVPAIKNCLIIRCADCRVVETVEVDPGVNTRFFNQRLAVNGWRTFGNDPVIACCGNCVRVRAEQAADYN